MIFAEALHSLDEYRAFTAAIDAPVLANITEFGQTPLFTVDELRAAGVGLVLYPLSAFRAMSAAALTRVRGHPPRRNASTDGTERCRPVPSSTTSSGTSNTSASSMIYSPHAFRLHRLSVS